MNYSINLGKNCLSQLSLVLNQPNVKQNIKNVIGYFTFAIGPWVAVSTVSDLKDRAKTLSLSDLSSRFSLMLHAAVSPTGIIVISKIANTIFSRTTLDRCGEYTIFAINPWHPRHVVSIAAVLFAIPAFIHVMNKKIVQKQNLQERDNVHALALLITLMSRPIQHIVNQQVLKAVH